MCVCLLGRKPLNALLVINDSLDFLRKSLKFFDVACVLLLCDLLSYQGELDCQYIRCHHLCTVSFGCCNRNFRSRKCIEYIICLTGNRRSHNIYDRKRSDSMILTQSQCCKAVCGLSGLTDHDRQCMRIQDRITITEFRRKFHTNRNSCHIFDHILCSHSYMIRRATGNDINLGNIFDLIL